MLAVVILISKLIFGFFGIDFIVILKLTKNVSKSAHIVFIRLFNDLLLAMAHGENPCHIIILAKHIIKLVFLVLGIVKKSCKIFIFELI